MNLAKTLKPCLRGALPLALVGAVLLTAAPLWAVNEWLVITDMNDPSDWTVYTDPAGSVLRLRGVEGETPDDRALEMAYDFGNGNYVIATKHGHWDLSTMKDLRVRLRGSGQSDNIEIKFTDERGVVYMARRIGVLANANWADLTFPVDQFGYTFGGLDTKTIDWKRIKTLDIVLVSGGIKSDKPQIVLLTDISAFMGEKEARAEFTLDDFKGGTPINRYQVRSAPNSSLDFNLSRNTFINDFSLEMTYTLGDVSTEFSWTRIEALGQRSLNWVTVDKIEFYFFGDGSSNHLQFFVEDTQGRIMVVPLDNYMSNNFWQTIEISRQDFQPLGEEEADWKQLRTYGLLIRSNPVQEARNQGRIYVEDFKLLGKKLASAYELSPWYTVAPEYFLENFSFYGFSRTEFYHAKNQPMRFYQELPLSILGNFNQFSFNFEISALSTEWGTGPEGFLSLQNPIESANLQVSLHKLLPGVELVQLGSLWVDLSNYLLSTNAFTKNVPGLGTWGLRGLRVHGWLADYGLDHDTYFIKNVDDSFTLANQLIWQDPLLGLRISNLVVLYQHEPYATLSSQVDLQDLSDLVEIEHLLAGFNRQVKFTARGGFDRFTTNDRAQIGIYQESWTDLGTLLEGELDMRDFMHSSLDFLLSGRRADPSFKPMFRENPWFFDSDIADQIEGRARVTCHVTPNIHPYTEYEYLQRLSDKQYQTKRAKLGVDMGKDKTYNTTLEVYYLDSDYYYYNQRYDVKWGDDRQSILLANELSWNAFWKLSAFVTQSLQVGFEYTYRDIYDRWDNFFTNEEEMLLKGTFYISNNSSLNLEQSFKRYRLYGRELIPAEEVDPLYDKNYTRVWLQLNF